ncbi:hypothetical protein FGO68_gene3096 [Halteria grandinella]|uniref:Glycoside hydrolase family 5 C-terminal domain-containing protein n=1 Tax=Halteria grandinella TaxID=5974 RepID=A0A8J8NRX3_HALGN|nr:hypothetical protein FGO68_gene3096 [Halteria grandinella]
MALRKSQNAPLFISQFGNCLNSVECIEEINSVIDSCETNVCNGWSYMGYKSFGGLAVGLYGVDGGLEGDKVKALQRPWVKAVQGMLTQTKFKRNLTVFQASWIVDTTIQGKTEVYINWETYYKKGAQIQLNIDGQQVYNGFSIDVVLKKNHILIHITSSAFNGKEAFLLIVPPNYKI